MSEIGLRELKDLVIYKHENMRFFGSNIKFHNYILSKSIL